MAGRTHAMHDEGYDSVRFIATLMILLHHFYTTCKEQVLPLHNIAKMIISRLHMGEVGVGLFFILSGALLWKVNAKSFSIKEFYRKRAFRIFVPYWIGIAMILPIMYIVQKDIFFHIQQAGAGNIIPLIGLYFCVEFWEQFGVRPGPLLVGEWFTAVIVILYCIFPVLNWLFRRYRAIVTVLIMIIFAANLYFEILTYHSGYFSVTNGLMYFWLGMLFEEYKSKFTKQISIVALVTIGMILIVNPSGILGVIYLPCFFLSVATFICLYYMRLNGWLEKYVCRYNYEVYLLHHRIFLLFMPMLLTQESSQFQIGMCFIVLVSLSFILAEKLQAASKFVVAHL